MSLQNALSDAQIERMETALYEILASSGRKFADKISYTVTRFGTIYLEVTIEGQSFERRIEFFVKSEDQIVYNVYTSTGKMYSWGEPCDLEGVLSLAGMDQEIVDGFEAEIADEKAKKQLATFEKMKTTGAKVKDSTLDKLKDQVEKFNSLAKTPAQEEHIEQYHRSIEQLGSLAKTIRDLSHGDKDKAGLRFISSPFMGSPEIEDIVNEVNESSEDGDYNKYKDELNTLPSDSIGMAAYKYIDKQINNPSEKGMYAVITRKKYDEDTWKNHIKPALQSIGMDKFMGVLNFDKHGGGLQYQIPFYFIQKLGTEKAKQFLKDTFILGL